MVDIMNITFMHNPKKDDINCLYNGLVDFNEIFFPNFEENTFGCFLKNDEEKIIGGLAGKIIYSNMLIDYFWVEESNRLSGVGQKLIKLAEDEAKKMGVCYINLDTYSFQAPKFYEKMGFLEVGRFVNYPKNGTDKVFYQKKLNE